MGRPLDISLDVSARVMRRSAYRGRPYGVMHASGCPRGEEKADQGSENQMTH